MVTRKQQVSRMGFVLLVIIILSILLIRITVHYCSIICYSINFLVIMFSCDYVSIRVNRDRAIPQDRPGE